MADEIEVSVTALVDLATAFDEDGPYSSKECYRTSFTSALINKWDLVQNLWCHEQICVRSSDRSGTYDPGLGC